MSILHTEEKKSLLSELLESDEEAEKPPETPENLSEASDADDEEKVKDKTPTVRSKFRRTLTKLKVPVPAACVIITVLDRLCGIFWHTSQILSQLPVPLYRK